MPKAEILLATYNGEKYLAEQLDSLLRQTWSDIHITVSDDASTDRTIEIIEGYAARYPETITHLNHGKHFGNARDHFFFLMQQYSGDYILFCDQDDVWNPDKVEITMKALLQTESDCGSETPVLVFTDQTVADEQLRMITPSLMKMQMQDASVIDYRRLLLQNIVTGCAMGINQSLAKLAVQCRNVRETVMHDWWLGIVAARFGKLIYIDRSTMFYRQHGHNSVGAKKVGSLKYFLKKMSQLEALRSQIQQKKAQAACFWETYAETLEAADYEFLKQYSLPRSGMRFYLKNKQLFSSFFRFAGALILG